MDECQARGMQRLTREHRQLGAQRFGKLAQLRLEAETIERVADHRMADMGEVHAYLMGAPGLERAFEQRGDRSLPPFAAPEGRQHAPMGHGLASLAGSQHRHLRAARRMTADRSTDAAVRPLRRAPHESEIATLELAGAAVV